MCISLYICEDLKKWINLSYYIVMVKPNRIPNNNDNNNNNNNNNNLLKCPY